MQSELKSFEFKANPKPKYIANITQVIPIRTGSLVLRRNLSTSRFLIFQMGILERILPSDGALAHSMLSYSKYNDIKSWH